MTIGQVKELVIALLDEKTDRDYKNKIPLFIDQGQRQIASFACPILKSEVVIFDVKGTDLPPLCHRVIKAEKDGREVCFSVFGQKICFSHSGEYTVFYEKRPDAITLETPLDTQLEIREDAAAALPYYVAAQCILKEHDQRYYFALLDNYNGIMANLRADHVDRGIVCTFTM